MGIRHGRFASLLVAGACLVLATRASPAAAQAGGHPVISARSFTGGSAVTSVTGAVQFEQDVPINTQASFGDGTSTWLQFGVSGAETPNVLITYGETGETGIIVGKGKFSATAGVTPGVTPPECTGKTEVTPAQVSGEYHCPDVVSYNAKTGKMDKVDIAVRFTAK
jgi:hypothetical protein